MELKITRVIWNDMPQHEDIKVTEYIYPHDIAKIGQSLKGESFTEILFSWGDFITISEEVSEFKSRVDKFIKQKEEDEREEERRRDLGY